MPPAGGLTRAFNRSYPLEAAFLRAVFVEDYPVRLAAWIGNAQAMRNRRARGLITYASVGFPEFLERVERLATGGNRPFFLHYHSTVTHKPVFHRRHRVFSELGNADGSPCGQLLRKRRKCNGEPLTDREEMDLYDDALLDMDAEMERLLRLLERTGRDEDTVVILTTDHELNWGTTGDPVALMIRLPGAQGGGRIISEKVWLLDLAPTMLAMLGYAKPNWMEGVSLLPLLEGREHDFSPERPVPMHVAYGQARTLGRITVVSGGYKFSQRMYSAGEEYVFNVTAGLDGVPVTVGNGNAAAIERLRKRAESVIARAR